MGRRGWRKLGPSQSPEPRNNPSLADVFSISVFMAVFFPLFVVLLTFACLHLFLPRDDRRAARDDDDDSVSASELSRRGPAARTGSTRAEVGLPAMATSPWI
jgi:E3 ubiquitin-protein ligase ATL6/9/15/31/42/55